MYRLHYAPDNASLIVRLVLEEMGQPHECVLVDRSAGAQNSPDYLALNPLGLIPVLETPDGPMFETGAILLWLADRHGVMAPAPQSPGRAAFLKWLFFLSNGLHTDLRQLFYSDQYAGSDAGCRTSHSALTQGRVRRNLALLDEQVEASHSWLGATDPSVIDYYLATCLRWLALYPKGHCDWFDLSMTPALARFARALEGRPAVHSAIHAEGLGPAPFSHPKYARPAKGSAT